jgi:hypothetical protein
MIQQAEVIVDQRAVHVVPALIADLGVEATLPEVLQRLGVEPSNGSPEVNGQSSESGSS